MLPQKVTLYKNKYKMPDYHFQKSNLILTEYNKFNAFNHLKPKTSKISNSVIIDKPKNKKQTTSNATLNYKNSKLNSLLKSKCSQKYLNMSNIQKSSPKTSKCNSKSNSINNLIDINISFNYKNISLNDHKYKKIYYNNVNNETNSRSNNNKKNKRNKNNIDINNINNFSNNNFTNSINSSNINNTINNSTKSKYLVSPIHNDNKIIFGDSYPNNFKKRKTSAPNIKTQNKNKIYKNNNNDFYNMNSLIANNNKKYKANCYSCKNSYSPLPLLSHNNETKNEIYSIIKTNLNRKLKKLFNYKTNSYCNMNTNTNHPKIKINEVNNNIFSIIKNTFFKFCNLCENQNQKELAAEILSSINQYNKIRLNQISKIEKENEYLTKKNKELINLNNKLKNENFNVNNKYISVKKELNDLTNKLVIKINENNNTNNNEINDENNVLNNENDEVNQENVVKGTSQSSSYVNTEELESIRFFDKIKMKKHSFSNSNIPKLSLDKIKLKNLEELNNNIENENNIKAKRSKNSSINITNNNSSSMNSSANNSSMNNKTNIVNGYNINKHKGIFPVMNEIKNNNKKNK